MPKLIIKKGESIVKKLSVPQDVQAFTVGCERGNDIIIKDDTISFFHLQFEKQNGGYYVRDLQSQWGTFVNGEKISTRTQISDQDEVRLGRHTIVFSGVGFKEKPPQKPERVLQAEPQRTQAKKIALPQVSNPISGIPSLDGLNTWLNDEDGDSPAVEVQSQTDTQSDISLPLSPTPPSDPTPTGPEPTFTPVEQPHRHPNGSQPPPGIESSEQEYKSKQEYKSDSSYAEYRSDPAMMGKTSYAPDTSIAVSRTPGPDYAATGTAPIPAPYATTSPQKSKKEQTSQYLLGIYGYYLGRKFKIKRPETRIGRDGKLNDIIIRKSAKGKLDQSVSRRHATLKFRNGKWYVSDKRSKTRTWVNRKKLSAADEISIKPGDELEIVSDQKSHIFRMVDDGDWDYSYPHRTGAWHIRNLAKMLNVSTIFISVLATLGIVNSCTHISQVTSQPSQLVLEDKIWGASDIDSRFDDFGQKKILISPAIGELNGDDFIDLTYVNNDRRLTAINGESKAPLWTNQDFEINPATPVMVSDIFNKGSDDIIAISTDSRIRVIDGRWGIEIGKSRILPGPLVGAPTINDFDGDGLKDIAIVGADAGIHVGFAVPGNFRWTTISVDSPLRSTLSSGDVTGDGVANILAGSEDGYLFIIDGRSQKVIRRVNVNEELNKASGRFDQNSHLRYPASMVDLNGDQLEDIVVYTSEGNLLVLAGGTLNRLWYDILNEPRDPTGTLGMALGDLDGDGRNDLVIRTPGGRLRALKGNGQGKDRKLVFWEMGNADGEKFTNMPAMADFNKNGTMDVLAVNDKQIRIIEGATGDIILTHNNRGAQVQSHPLIGDLDNDNYSDVLLLKSDGRFHKLQSNCKNIGGFIPWGQLYSNEAHTSLATLRNASTAGAILTIVIAIMITLGVAGIQFWFVISRRKLNVY